MSTARRKPGARAFQLLLACVLAASLSACVPEAEPLPTQSPTPSHPRAQLTPAPTLENEPAALYTSILTDKRVISLVLEGFTDETSMRAIISTLQSQRVPAVFFVSGVVADEHPATVKQIAAAGFAIGNYGLSASKNMQNNDVYRNLHQFRRGQELIVAAAGVTPSLFRCNGSAYTRELLQAGAAAGLSAGVMPTLFLNHTSFDEYEDALLYVQRMARGSVVTVKLGQVLDSSEFGGLAYSMSNRAIDPEPFLSDRMEDTISETYMNITNVVAWLMTALDAEGYIVLSPEALQAERITMFDNPAPLDAETLAVLDDETYTLPVTASALDYRLPEPVYGQATAEPTTTPKGKQKDDPTPSPLTGGIAIVGDSIIGGLSGYVAWQRQTQPAFQPSLTFLTADAFSLGTTLRQNGAANTLLQVDTVPVDLVTGATLLGAHTLLITPGLADVRAYSLETFVDTLKLTLYQLRTQLPETDVWLLSIPPGIDGRAGALDNTKIFRYNLAMYRFCREYDVPFLDVAYRLRDANGNLPAHYCLDANTQGIHLSDAACRIWLNILRTFLADQ